MTERGIITWRDVDELNRKAAEQFLALANKAIQESGQFIVALFGGSTPKALYSLLASASYKGRVDWSRVHLFWGDERCISLGSSRETPLLSYPLEKRSIAKRSDHQPN